MQQYHTNNCVHKTTTETWPQPAETSPPYHVLFEAQFKIILHSRSQYSI